MFFPRGGRPHAAPHPWHCQEDDRRPQGLLHLVGQGAAKARPHQRSVTEINTYINKTSKECKAFVGGRSSK